MESKEQSFYIAVILYESSSNNPGYKPLGMLCSNQSLFSKRSSRKSFHTCE